MQVIMSLEKYLAHKKITSTLLFSIQSEVTDPIQKISKLDIMTLSSLEKKFI